MANIPDGTFRDWKTGDIMGEADYEQEREIIRTAINDNYSRVTKTYTQTQVDTKINDAVSGVQASKVVETGTTFPTSPTEGQMFFNTTDLVLYVYSGTAWKVDGVNKGTTFPTTAQEGQPFFKTDEKVLYVYSGGVWEKSVTLSSLGGIPSTEKGAASGVATLDANGDVPVSQLDNVKSVTGTYTGNGDWVEGSVYTQDINLGFKPSAVVVGRANGSPFFRDDGEQQSYGGLAVDGSPASYSSTAPSVEIISTGFRVYNHRTATSNTYTYGAKANNSGWVYNYTAFK